MQSEPMRHRIFIALRPPSVLRDALIDLMEGVEDARWQGEDQLHLTLRFIGETDPHRADDLAEALEGLHGEPFELTIAGTGIFERKGVAHTLWAGIAPCRQLNDLQRKIERVCVRAGFEAEHRKFHPHITLARLNRASGPTAEFLARTAALRLGPWPVDSYILYESHLRPEGPAYEPVIRYPLDAKP